MKKYDFFLPSRPPFLQDFCKNAQWRAKKLRERGSNTARPTEKGVGGLTIRSIRSISARRFGRFRSIWSAACVASCRFGRFRRVDSVDLECCLCRDLACRLCRSRRFGRVVSRRSQGANTKKARFLNRGIGVSYRKASRALNLLSVPLSNTRASARGVRLGLARRSCIVRPTSDRRRIGRCT